MKYISFFVVLLSAINGIAQIDTISKGTTKTKDGIIYYKDNLPLFQIDSCMEDLLTAIAEADKNASYFDDQIGTRFYSLETQDRDEYISLDIWPVRKKRSDFFDYYGAIEIQDVVFLLRGKYRSRSLFHSTRKGSLSIELQRPQKNKAMDEIDKKLYELVLNPALYGTYIECTGLKIVTSVYIEGKISGFEVGSKKKSTSRQRSKTATDEKSLNDSILIIYEDAYQRLSKNIESNPSFKESVLITENAFFGNKLPVDDIKSLINGLVSLCSEWKHANPLKGYRFKDSLNLLNNFAIYTILKDTVGVQGPNGQQYGHLPYIYDFNDFFGRQQWSNMFVSKLLVSQRGNCHSFPYLYKILADELGTTCWLSLAPNHIYIKNRCKKIGWYNTELTSGEFPIDAWITTSGYIPLKAIQTGLYMDTLSNQQAVALSVLDLAKGYEFKTKNYYDGFIVQCCDLVLQYHPVNAQALLLKAESLKRIYEKQLAENNTNSKETYKEMERLYTKLLDLGYREMPEKMYMQWLMSVTQQKDKYSNSQIKATFQQGKSKVK